SVWCWYRTINRRGAMTSEEPAVPVPPAPAPAQAAEEYLFHIGDIGVTPHWIVSPRGNAPLAGSQWTIVDQTRVTRKTPAWAIVLTIALFFVIFLFSLLFLLAKKDTVTGWLEVTAASGSFRATAQVVVRDDSGIMAVRQNVARAQSIAAALSA